MKPPIFVYEPDDLDVFESLDSAQLKVEPIDVKDNAFLYFDSEGTILEASVVRDHRGIELTVIHESNPTEFNQPALTRILKDFLIALDYPSDQLDAMPLPELVMESLKYKTR